MQNGLMGGMGGFLQSLYANRRQPTGLQGFDPNQQQGIMREAQQRGLSMYSTPQQWQQGQGMGGGMAGILGSMGSAGGLSPAQLDARGVAGPSPGNPEVYGPRNPAPGGMGGGNPMYQPNWGGMFGPIVSNYQQQAQQAAQKPGATGGRMFGGGGGGGMMGNFLAGAARGRRMRAGMRAGGLY